MDLIIKRDKSSRLMATKAHWSCRWLSLIVWWQMVYSEPQIHDLGTECRSVLPKNTAEFVSHLNSTFSELRTRLLEDQNRFATAQAGNASDPVFALVQCRSYMSQPDCLACYDAALSEIRNCSNAKGARVTFDGCFLRYEDYNFFTKWNDNDRNCKSKNRNPPTEFWEETRLLLRDLQVATPKIRGYFAASKREIPTVKNLTVYAVAQCQETITPDACRVCMTAAYETIQGCLYSADGRLTDVACFMRFSDTPFFAHNQTTNLNPYLQNSWKQYRGVVAGAGGGAGLFVIIVPLVLWYIFSRKLKIVTRGDILGATELQLPNIYSYRDLEAATNNFSQENILGQGSFGVVYKATLKIGNIVAVKKLDISYSRAKADFETESRLVSNVHHRNLVRLLGCCCKRSELLLIYEYMENGSLDRFLYGEKRGSLTWKQRCDIIYGIARGIAYLHDHYHVTIIHRDIKPSNILLDTQFQPKIADFGLVRPFPQSRSHLSTKFAGTLGYTAPEYAVNGHLSEKVDVYSFGIVILEIISGRRCSDVDEDSENGYLLEHAWKLYENGMHDKLADEALELTEVDDLKKMVEIGLVCTQLPSSSRPTMSEILVMFQSDPSVLEIAPKRPSSNWYESNGSSASNATVSITHYTGR